MDPMNITNKHSIFNDINRLQYSITTWIEQYSRHLQWLREYKAPIMIITILVVILALFNISLSIWILAQDKLGQAAVLLTLGFNKKMIALTLIIQNIILTLISILISIAISTGILSLQSHYKFVLWYAHMC